jgi:hypothetical protein
LAPRVNAGIVAAIRIKFMPVEWIETLGCNGQDAGFWAGAAGFDINHDVSHDHMLTYSLV